MRSSQVEQVLNLKTYYIITLIEQFLIAKRAENLSRNTQDFYKKELTKFQTFLDGRIITTVEQITADDLRQFLLWMERAGHTPGGVHCAYRVVKTFLFWYESEFEPEGWHNPIRKVRSPKIPKEPIIGIEQDDFTRLYQACAGHGFTAIRDRVLILFMLDTGARASELLSINLADIEQASGRVLIRQGKGRKPRVTFFGSRTRRAIRDYLKVRDESNPALWLSDDGERLSYSGLRLLIRRRSIKAGLAEIPSPHDFRRSFAISYLRAGGDIFTLQKLMGHADIQVLRRYLAQCDGDLQEGHARFGPVDNLEG